MSNILEQEDYIKGLPDSELQRMVAQPSGDIPDFLPLSEINRRTEMRKKYAATEQPQMRSIASNIMAEGLASVSPQRSSAPPALPTPALPVGGGTQGLGGMGVQGYNTGGVIKMNDGRQTPRPQTGASNMVAAVDAATNMLRAKGRDASIYSQAELRKIGEEILGTNTGPTLLQQGYKESRPDLGSDYEIDSVSGYRTDPFATPPVIDKGIELAGDAKDYVVDAAGNVADYFREDEQLGILGEAVSGSYIKMKDAAGSGLNYLGDKYDSVSDAYNSSFMATPVTELFRNPFDSTRNDEFAADHGYDMQGPAALSPNDLTGVDTSASDGNIPLPYGYNTISSMYPFSGALSKAYDYLLGGDEESAKKVAEKVAEEGAEEGAEQNVVSTVQNTRAILTDNARRQVNPRFDQGRMVTAAASEDPILDFMKEEYQTSNQVGEDMITGMRSLVDETRATAKNQAFYLGMAALGAGISSGNMAEGMEKAVDIAGKTMQAGEKTAGAVELEMLTVKPQQSRDRVDTLAAMARADAQYLAIEERATAQGHMSERNKRDLVRAALPLAQQVLDDAGVFPNDPNYTAVFNNLMTQYLDYANLGAPLNNSGPRNRDLTSFDSPE